MTRIKTDFFGASIVAVLGVTRLVLLSSIVCVSSVYAQEFEVAGWIMHKVFVNDSNVASFTNDFQVTVSDCASLVVVCDRGSRILTHCASDSGVLYWLRSFPASPSNPKGVNTGVIEPEDVPKDDGTTVNYLWFAYASHCFLQHSDGHKLRPIWLLDDPNLIRENFTVDTSAHWLHPIYRLPERVMFLNDGYHRGLMGDQRITNRYAKPFEDGFTNAIYEVSGTTNLETFSIPTGFQFARYYVDGDTLRERTITRAIATNFASKSRASQPFRPQYSGLAYLADKRFQLRKPPVAVLRYTNADSAWPSEAALQDKYQRRAVTEQKASNIRKGRGNFIIVVFVLLLLIPPVVALRGVFARR